MAYPVGGTERNLLIEPSVGKYRLTRSGFDVRTADPTTNPEQFEFWEDSLSFDLVLAAGSFIPDSTDLQNIPVAGMDQESLYIFYYSDGTKYYLHPGMTGKFGSSNTYSSGMRCYVDPVGPDWQLVGGAYTTPRMKLLEYPTIFKKAGQSADWSYTTGLNTVINWSANPVNWVKLSLVPDKSAGTTPGLNRFKVRSTADGGGFMIASKDNDVESTNLDDFIVHPDKKTVQLIATYEGGIASGSSALVPMPANYGKPMPLVFQRSSPNYFDPLMKAGYVLSVCQFEYEAGGVRIYNDANTVNADFTILFLNVEMQ